MKMTPEIFKKCREIDFEKIDTNTISHVCDNYETSSKVMYSEFDKCLVVIWNSVGAINYYADELDDIRLVPDVIINDEPYYIGDVIKYKGGDFELIRVVDDSHIVVNAKDVYDGIFRDNCLNVNYFKRKHKKSGWINIYPSHSDTKVGLTSTVVYATEEEAKSSADKLCAATIQINWEE